MLASFLRDKQLANTSTKSIYGIQFGVVLLLVIGLFVLNTWAFPVHRVGVIAGWIVLLAIVFYFMRSVFLNKLQRAIAFSVAAMALCFFLLNTSFYPQLLTYQGGNQLAFATKGKVDPAQVYYWGDMQSSSFGFYTKQLRQAFSDTVIRPGTTQWLLFDIHQEKEIEAAGYHLGTRYTSRDYEITKLDIRFVNPAKRDSQCTEMVLAQISR